jgi:hypothetical protein
MRPRDEAWALSGWWAKVAPFRFSSTNMRQDSPYRIDLINAAMGAQRLTNAVVARKAGVGVMTVSKIRNGKLTVGYVTLKKNCRGCWSDDGRSFHAETTLRVRRCAIDVVRAVKRLIASARDRTLKLHTLSIDGHG